MTRTLLSALCGLAALLAATVAAEFRQTSPTPAADVGVSALPASATPVAAAKTADAAQVSSWAAAILARPLFNRDRRPVDAPAVAAAVQSSLPRLTGIAVSPAGRHAIFANPGGKPLVTSPGDHVAGFTVQEINPGAVTMVGPGGSRVLQPSFEGPPHAAFGAASPSSIASGVAQEFPEGLSPPRMLPTRAHFPEPEFNRMAQRPGAFP